MLKKAQLFRLAALAGILVVALLAVVTLSLPQTASPAVIPTLQQLPTEAEEQVNQVAAQPKVVAVPVTRAVQEDAVPPVEAPASPVVAANVPPTLKQPATLIAETALLNLIPTIEATDSQGNTVVTGALPTALPFPTLPLVAAPTIPFVEVPLPQAPVPNQVVISFKPDTSAQERAAYIASLGGVVKQSIDALDTVVIEVPPTQSTFSLPNSDAVFASEPDYFVSAQVAVPPSDPLYGSQWALPAIGASAGWQALPANAQQVVVAVIDSGVCLNHPDLAGRILPGWDYIDNDNQPQDDFGHGCGVAGIIAANVNDGIGMAGVAPNALILPLRVLNAQGLGMYSDVAAAVVFAADHNAKIINLSLGGTVRSSVLETAIDYAVGKGVMVVAAAGNNGGAVLYPAAYAPVIAVGSVDPNLQRSSFSSFGPEIDFLAPGRDIETTTRTGQYALVSGTSFAAPQVAGVAALEIANGHTLSALNGIIHVTGAGPSATVAPTIAPSATVSPDEVIKGQLNLSGAPTRVPNVADNLTTDLGALALSWGENRGQALELSETHALEITGDSVTVTVTGTTVAAASAAKAQVTALGGEVRSSYDRWFDAVVPITKLKDVAGLPGVLLVQPIVRTFPVDDGVPAAAPHDDVGAQAGTYLSQGVAASNASVWQAAGITGAGVTVAVVDCGFSNVSSLQTNGDLPPTGRLTTLGTIISCDHGSGVAEIVYDMAPGINMILVSPQTGTEMASRIQELADMPVGTRPKVITSSISYYNLEAGDGFGPVSSAIAYAANKGVLYTQAAGNQARYNWQGNFVDGNGDKYLDFNGNLNVNVLNAVLPAGFPLQLYMRWNNWPSTHEDYDLYLVYFDQVHSQWIFADKSETDQSGTASSPVESIFYITPVSGIYGIAVLDFSTNHAITHVIDIMGHNAPPFLYDMTDRSLVDASTSIAAFGVAALDVHSPYPLESYSSRGDALGAGGSLLDGNDQPRIASYANVDTWTYGPGVFNGTSAATPHVAGAAALVWQANPTYTVAQVKNFLESRSIDQLPVGYDLTYGKGRLYLGTPPSAPTITTDPQNQTIAANQAATLSVIAVGTAPLNYQWYQGVSGNTAQPVGTNSSTFITPTLTTTTSYWVRVSNVAGHDDSTTAVVTVNSVPNDTIFSDGFESGSLNAWTSNVNDGGDLSVTAGAALSGNFGLQALIDDTTAIYTADDTPNAEPRYRARFYLDPNALVMANNDQFVVLGGYQGGTVPLQVVLLRIGGVYKLAALAQTDGGAFLNSTLVTISDAPHLVELDWKASTAAGANNGSLTFWVDEAQQPIVSNIDNDSKRIDQARLGAVAGIDPGTSGTLYFDAFISRRATYIGYLLAAPTLVSPASGTVMNSNIAPSLSWNPVQGASQYQVEFTNGSTIDLLSTWGSTTSPYSPGVQPPGSYQWRVHARLAASLEESAWSAFRTLVIRPRPASSLQGSTPTPPQVKLIWTAAPDAPAVIDGYHIYREGALIGSTNSATTSFNDATAAGCTTYHYIVRTYKGSIEAADSNTATVSPSCEAIFSNGFETGNLTAWTSNVNDGGDLGVTTAAHLTSSTYGLQALIDDTTAIYVADDTPNAEPRYRARFYIDPNTLTMANNDQFVVLGGYQGGTVPLQVVLLRIGGVYKLAALAQTDSGAFLNSALVTISDAPHLVELDWKASTAAGANNGSLTFWVDEAQQPVVSNIDNDSKRIDQARLGAVAGIDPGTSGTLYFDAFVSRRVNYSGPEVGGLGVEVEPTETPTVEATETIEATDEITPTVEATETVEPTETPTVEVTEVVTPTVEPTATPTVEPTLQPFTLPLFQTMDDGAPLWAASSGWQLSAEAAYTGLGWRVQSSGQVETLALKAPVSLGAAQAPHLSFQSWLASAAAAEVQISLDGATWQTVQLIAPSAGWTPTQIDLSAYAGQTVWLRFVWASPAGVSDSWQVDEVTLADQPAVVPTIAPSATEPPPSSPTPEVVEPGDLPTIETGLPDMLPGAPTRSAPPLGG